MASSSPNKRREMDLYKLSASWFPAGGAVPAKRVESPLEWPELPPHASSMRSDDGL